MRKSFIALVFLSFCSMLVAQQALNNDAVIKLVKAGLSDDLIVSTVNAQAGIYDTSTDGLIALKTAGVGDKVVAAIVAKANVVAVAAAAPIPALAPMPAQGSVADSNAAPAPQIPPPPFHSTDGRIRIYVTDHPMFEANAVANGDSSVEHKQVGDDPRTVEIQADILKVCPANVMASNNPDRADYVLVFRRRGGARSSMFAFGGLYGLAFSAAMKVDGASLFENNGDMVYATKQTTVEKSIKDVCDHIPSPTAVSALTPATTPN